MDFLNSPQGAAWFQAVFTLIGIGVAIFVPWRQNKNASKRKSQSIEFETKCCLLTLKAMQERYLNIAKVIEMSDENERVGLVQALPATTLSSEARILREIPAHKFHETKNVDLLLRTMTIIDYVIQANNEIKEIMNIPANNESISYLNKKSKELGIFVIDQKKVMTEIMGQVSQRLEDDDQGVALKKENQNV